MKVKLLLIFIIFVICFNIPLKKTICITNDQTSITYSIPVDKDDTLTMLTGSTKELLTVQQDYLIAQNPDRQIDELILFIGSNQKLLSNNVNLDLQQLGSTGQKLTIELKPASYIDILKTIIILTV